MPLQSFHQGKTKIDSLINKAKKIDDLEIKNDFSRYITVRISGFIEITVRECYDQYTSKKASPDVHRYVTRKLKRFQNPRVKDIIELARDFNEGWAAELESVDMEMSDAVDSIVTIRHSVAHGGNRGISLANVEQYYKQVLKFLELIQKQCKII